MKIKNLKFKIVLPLIILLAGGFFLFQSAGRRITQPKLISQANKVSTIANLAQPAPKLTPTLPNTPNSPYSYSAQIDPSTQALFAEKNSTKPSYEIKQGNYSLKFTLDSSLNTPEVGFDSSGVKKIGDNVIEYAVTISGIPMTLRHTISPTGVKEEFIIDKKPNLAMPSEAWEPMLKIPFTMESQGLKVKDEGQGRYTFTDSQNQTVWSIEPPTVTDAKGKTGQITASLSPVILNPKGEGSLANASTSETSSEILRSAQNDIYTLSLPTNYLLQATYPVVIDPTVIINTSSTTGASGPSTMRHIVRTSDGTLHSFVQVGTQTATCGGSSKSGLLWFNSTDNGTTWTCQGQLSSDTTNLMYADARVDTSDNIYVVYSTASTGANASYDVFYSKLTKGAGATWTLESAQTVLDGITPATSCSTVNTGSYSYATIELEGTTRAWLATRCYDGTNYQVSVYYSDGLGTSPTWTQSVATLDTANSTNWAHFPLIVRFGSQIGVIYATSESNKTYIWRFRTDGDNLTSWVAEKMVIYTGFTPSPNYTSAIGDASGHVALAVNSSSAIQFAYYDGVVWTQATTVISSIASNAFVSLATDGTNIWSFYKDTSGLSSGLSGSAKLVYKKAVPPFTSSDFDSTATAVVSYHGVFDKAWSYVASAYTDITTAAGNTTSADTQMITSSGDIAYFGKSTTYDAISWDVSTAGNSGGAITWEYCSAVDVNTACTTWSALSFTSQTSAAASEFEADGYGAFTTPGDWVAAKVNSEDTAYYYIRARATASYTTSPVGVQMAAIPQINWANVTATVASNTIHAVWTENAASPTKVRYIGISATASTAPATTANLSPVTAAYSSATTATQPSTMRHIVRTSDGTLHAFIQGGTQLTCGGQTGNNNTGLNWIYSTNSGSTWTCGGQIDSGTSTLFYADARADSSDNIYVVYSTASTGASASYDVLYRKLTKGSGSTWTMEAAQTVLDGITPATSCATANTGSYSYATIELEGTTRAWLATRCYDGTNYQISVYYSDGLTAAPTWTQSVAALDTADTSANYHYPALVRFGTKIGIIYWDARGGGIYAKWRYRADSDGLTSWVTAGNTGTLGDLPVTPSLSAAGDTNGNIYITNTGWCCGAYFAYYNGSTWSNAVNFSTALNQDITSIATDGTNAWIFYKDTSGLSSGLSGKTKLVYKKGVPPFAAANFDTNSTAVVSQHGIFDKVWNFVSATSAYTDFTTAAGNTTSADVTMPSASGDIIYFGKTAKFDALSYDLSTSGTTGVVTWEYYNGSSWMPLTTFYAVSNNTFGGDGYISFDPHSDWAPTAINSEPVNYYYIRARVTTAYSTAPVGVQMAAIPQINWASALSSVNPQRALDLIWTENAASPTRIRFTSIPLTAVQINGGTTINGGTKFTTN